MRAPRFTLGSLPALVLIAGLGVGPVSTQADGQPAFVAGDLIVKFTAASEPGMLVDRAVRGDPTADRELAAFAARLARELGAALVVARVTSGNELVLSVNRDQLAQTLGEAVQRSPAVRAVTRADPPRTVLPAAEIALVLDLRRDSDASSLVRRTARAGKQTSNEIEALVKKLCVGVEPQPSGRVSNRQLVLSVDIAALTLDLVERLRRRPDVEYAQPSQVMKPYPGSVRQGISD